MKVLNETEKNYLMDLMAQNLLVLRTTLGTTQEELGEIIGLSRYTILGIESGKRKMTWNTFLSLILVFTKNERTNILLEPLGLYPLELEELISTDEKKENNRSN